MSGFPSQGYLVVDAKKCSGCQVCMFSCTIAHEGVGNVNLSRIQVLQDQFKDWPDSVKIMYCHQCEDPACVKACLFDACYIDKEHGNVRVIDLEKCVGCQACMQACPHQPGGVIWNSFIHKAVKCDLCAGAKYLENGGPGGVQACVMNCPQKAITYSAEMPPESSGKEGGK